MTDRRKKPKRPDICMEDVARRWIGGESILTLSIAYDCSVGTVENRLSRARRELPALPWDERGEAVSSVSTKDYVEMNDGKPGESRLRQGSVIRSSLMRRR